MFFIKKLYKLPTNPRYVTDKRLRTINVTADNIEKIIVSLNSNMVMTTSVYVCLKYVVIPFVNL